MVAAQRQRSRDAVPAARAAALVALHPASLSILPVVARRTEILMIVCVLAAFVAARKRGASRRAQSLSAAGFALLAVGSKEPGLVVLPLLAIDRLFMAWEEESGTSSPFRAGLSARVASVTRFVMLAMLGVAAFGLLRTVVLGGLGGYHASPDTPYLMRLIEFAPAYLGMVEVTGVLDTTAAGRPLALVSTTAILLGCVGLGRSRSKHRWVGEFTLPVLGLAWIGFQLALASTASKPEPRYVEGLVVGLAFVLAGFVDRSRVRSHDATVAGRARCRRAQVLLAISALVTVGALAGSPLWRENPALGEASRLQTAELAGLEARLRALPPGSRRVPVHIRKVVGSPDRVVDHAWMLSHWGLQAWLEMVFPERYFDVELDVLKPPDPVFWHLVIVERAPNAGL